MKIGPEITRIDFERQGNNVLAQFWKRGWQQGDMTGLCDYLVDTRIETCLRQCELDGFTVEMCDSFHGRALRGEITRIDFILLNGEYRIKKYPFGWTAKTRPIQDKALPIEKWKEAIQYCKDHGYTVREWPEGARAFKGKPLPVRDAKAILFMRKQVEANVHQLRQSDPRYFYDLAFDY